MIIELPERDTIDYFVNYSSAMNGNELNNTILIDIDRNIIGLKYNGAENEIAVIESYLKWDKNFSIIIGLDKKGEQLSHLGKYTKERNNELNSLMINKFNN